MIATNSWLFIFALLAALGCGLIAGLLFAFSNFVMQALAQQPDEQGIATMQAINVTIINPIFMLIFLGTAAICAAQIILSVPQLPARRPTYVLIGSLLYLAGTLGVTMIRNVPMNNRLEKVDPTDSNSATYWREYITSWMRWNHVRTIAATLASIAFMLALSSHG